MNNEEMRITDHAIFHEIVENIITYLEQHKSLPRQAHLKRGETIEDVQKILVESFHARGFARIVSIIED